MTVQDRFILLGIVVAFLALMGAIAWGQWYTRNITAPGAQPRDIAPGPKPKPPSVPARRP